MINPRSKLAGLRKKMFAGVGWFSRELPRTPTNFLQKGFSAQLRTTISKEGKNAARSQTVMEIPAITSETLTAPKPQQVNKIPVLTILYKKLLSTAENNICRKLNNLTAFQKSNTSKIWTPKSSFINQKQIYKRASSVSDSQIENESEMTS